MKKTFLLFVAYLVLSMMYGCSDSNIKNEDVVILSDDTSFQNSPYSDTNIVSEYTVPSDIVNDSGSAFVFTLETLTKAIDASGDSNIILPKAPGEWLEYPDLNSVDNITEYVWRENANAYLSPSITISVNNKGYITEIRTDRSEEARTEKGVTDFKMYSEILFDILCDLEGSEVSELIDTMCEEANLTLYGENPKSRFLNDVCITAYYNADRCTFAFSSARQ